MKLLVEDFINKLYYLGKGEVVLGSGSKFVGEVMLLASAIPFALDERKRKRQPDIVNDPWPPGLTE